VTGIFLFFIYSFFFFLSSCVTQEKLAARLERPKPTYEVRLDDIEKAVSEDPAKAIQLIEVFHEVYPEQNTGSYETEARSNLVAAQKTALEEKRWDDAASLARSLDALGIEVSSTGEEADILLEQAVAALEANKNLDAFLAAWRSDQIEPLKPDAAYQFYTRAKELGQRRNAAYFYRAALRESAGAALFTADDKAYATGSDTPQEMIRGVVTIIVDRGIKVQRGIGMSDMVLGSGFFIDADGTNALLVTNYHVIESEVSTTYEGYSRAYVRMGGPTEPRIPAKVVGWDKTMDLAIVRVAVKPGYVFSVIDQTDLEVGDSVFAIGSPGGLEKTVTRGIISALSRRFLPIGDVFQLDAAINHGNSGGPVVAPDGRFAGVVFAGVETFEGMNFAIPGKRVLAALPGLLSGGKAKRPWLGMVLAETNRQVEVVYVAPDTPASDLLVAEGAKIVTLAGKKAAAANGELIPAMQDALFPRRPGELVAMQTTLPNGETKNRVMQLAERPDMPMADAAKVDTKERLAAPLFGIVLESPIGDVKTPTYLIKKVIRGSIGDETGLQPQDPVTIRGLSVDDKQGVAMMLIDVKKRQSGYIETTLQLPANLDSTDVL
jgi:S1-C subfamily serine protease